MERPFARDDRHIWARRYRAMSSPTSPTRSPSASRTSSARASKKASSSDPSTGPACTAQQPCSPAPPSRAPGSTAPPSTRCGARVSASPPPTRNPRADRLFPAALLGSPRARRVPRQDRRARPRDRPGRPPQQRRTRRPRQTRDHCPGPHDKPLASDRSPAPLVHAATRAVRIMLRSAYYEFVAAFREAAIKLRRGDRLPQGAFPPPMPCLIPTG